MARTTAPAQARHAAGVPTPLPHAAYLKLEAPFFHGLAAPRP